MVTVKQAQKRDKKETLLLQSRVTFLCKYEAKKKKGILDYMVIAHLPMRETQFGHIIPEGNK